MIGVLLLVRNFSSYKYLVILGLFSGFMIFIVFKILIDLAYESLVVIYLRIMSISVLYTFFYSEMNPENLTKALIYFKIPYRYAWTISTAYRYIFLFVNDSTDIKNALLIRGVPLDGSYIQKIKNLPFVINLLLFRTNYLSLKFSEALYSKNWTPHGTKTWLSPLNIKQKINLPIIFILLILLIKIFFYLS